MTTRQTKAVRKHQPKWATPSGFRLIRVFSVEHNAVRMQAHVKKLKRRHALQPGAVRFRLRLRLLKRQKESPASGTAT